MKWLNITVVTLGVIMLLFIYVHATRCSSMGFCYSSTCWSSVNCGPDCFCLKKSGAVRGECYQR